MKPIRYKVLRTGDTVICKNPKNVQVIEDVKYVTVHRPGQDRDFLMRLEALVKLERDK